MDSLCHQVAVVYSKGSFNISLKLRWCEYGVWLQAGRLEEVFSSSVCPDQVDGHSASCSVFWVIFTGRDRRKKSRDRFIHTIYVKMEKFSVQGQISFIIQREVLSKGGIKFSVSNRNFFLNYF